MTSLESGSQHPRDEPPSLHDSSKRSADARSTGYRDSSEALQRRLSNVIDVQDPARILECSQLERQRSFQHLVRRYLSQILYGCKSACCDTSTCLSRNKRGASKPYRPPTQLTARALAHYLASQSNPYRGLCPHELKVSPTSFEIEATIDVNTRDGEVECTHRAQRVEQITTRQTVAHVVNSRHQTRKDTKSIGQNLYDSVSVIYSYSKSIPSPLLALHALRASHGDTRPDQRICSKNDTTGKTCANGSATITRQHSQEHLRAQSQAHATRDQPEVLSNGQLVHKVPYRPTNSDQAASIRYTDSALLEGTTGGPKMSITRTGRKSFTLGGPIAPTAGKPKPTAPLVLPPHNAPKSDKSRQTAIPTTSSLSCDTLNQLRDEIHRRQDQNSTNIAATKPSRLQCSPKDDNFVHRSLFYTLGHVETLLQSFHDSNEAFQSSPLPHLDSTRLAHSFRDWSQHTEALIFDSLSVTVDALLTRPPALESQAAADRNRPSNCPTAGFKDHQRYLNNHEAAHIVMICIHALTSSVPVGWPRTWAQVRSLRSWGVIIPSATAEADHFVDPYINIIDALEYEPAVMLAERLLRAIGVRSCFDHVLEAIHKKVVSTGSAPAAPEESLSSILIQHLEVIERVALDNKRKLNSATTTKDPGWTVTATLVEWLKTIIVKKWDGNVEVSKWSSVGAAVILLHKLHDRERQLNLWSRMFRIPYLHEHVNAVDEPVKYLDWKPQPNTLHVLGYPELHPTEYLVRFFRVVNLTSMMAQYDHTQHTQQMLRQLDSIIREPYLYMIKHRLKITLTDYLVLDVSREQPLKDTLDQLWRRERKTLLKPLKVKLGQQEGEVGLDHGGVTYEFFRVVLGEAFAPDYGMFTVDSKNQMTWFQPGCLEPLWKYKMLGVLFSLAIYNGITLPVTFPLAFYNLMLNSRFKFLDNHTSIEYIRDGWPDLAKSFETLLDWKDGDVADIFMRDYAFSYEVFGQKIDIDMTKRADVNSVSDEIPLVTNQTRGVFVRDYVAHLILHSIRPQLKAFKNGFHTCLDSRSLQLFTPQTLKKLVEGTQTISLPELRACATYEDYDATHPTVKMFWDIVQGYSQEDATHLLEFVTASDRVPVTGYKSLTFNIVRMGSDSEQLPTSSTCFGKLYLPEYKDKEKMRRKLELAIQNAKGFGVV
ncbi:Ubiquitin-protein ligase E3A [Stagonosporopsis vannaccii]|nr:Ubiquitin-protein ligase E3A [Stagonosporopsis vannaccii]